MLNNIFYTSGTSRSTRLAYAWAIVFSLLLCAAAVSFAQIATPQADPGATQAPEETILTPVTTENSDVPLEDYEASEQISEDLSVSFPVDI